MKNAAPTPPRIHVFPNWRSNPYLNMLYIGARAEGWQVDGTTRLPDLVAAIADLAAGDILHVHWTQPITQARRNPAAARRYLDLFVAATDAAVARGVRLVWTVHNHLPHTTRHLDLELEVNRYLASRAWRVIQLNPYTRQAVADLFDLPSESLVTLRHASYLGMYPSPPGQAAARELVGVPQEAPTVAFVGRIHPYKGINTLVDAVGLAARQVDGLTLLLAGRTEDAELADLTGSMPDGVRVIRFDGYVPDQEIGTWFAAADLLAFPYQRILNSGSVLLSATFGRPCVLPADPHLTAQYGDQEWISFFAADPSPAESLARAIVGALGSAPARRAAANRFAREYTTYDMAWGYLRIISGELATESATPAAEPGSPQLSVVVATHNDQDRLDELLRSVRSSEGVGLEVLVVDDGSSDDTWQIAHTHAAADPRVRVHRSPGEGAGAACDHGATLAGGDYLAFAAPGDIVPRRGYAALLDGAATGADVTVGGHLVLGTKSTVDPRAELALSTPRTTALAHDVTLLRRRTAWGLVARRATWLASGGFAGRQTSLVAVTRALADAGSVTVVPEVCYVHRPLPTRSAVALAELHLADERDCAELVTRRGGPDLIREFWQACLRRDTWQAVRDVVESSPFAPGRVPELLASLLAAAPRSDALRPHQAAGYALVAAGLVEDAATLLAARAKSAAVDLAALTEVLGRTRGLVHPTVVASLVCTLVVPRLDPPPPTPATAEHLIAVTRGLPLLDAAGDDLRERRLAAVLASGGADDLLAMLAGPRPLKASTRLGLRSAMIEGSTGVGDRPRLVAVHHSAKVEPVELPASAVLGGWRAQVPAGLLRPGRWTLSLDSEDAWGMSRRQVRLKARAARSPLDRLSRFAVSGDELLVRSGPGRRLRQVVRRLLRR